MDDVGGGALIRLASVLGLLTVLGALSVAAAPDTNHIGFMWPVGLAAGALLMAPRPATPYVVLLVVAIAAWTFWLEDHPIAVCVGYAAALGVEAVVAQQILTAGWTRRLRLEDTFDLGRYAAACGAAAAVGAAGFALTSAIGDVGVPWQVGIAAFVTHAANLAVVLGIFKSEGGPQGTYGVVERALVWGLTIGLTVLTFLPSDLPSLTFVVIPLLGWSAFRAPMREAMAHLITVAVLSSVLTALDHGPFADPFLLRRLLPEFWLLPHQLFLLTCALVSIPFSMAVGMQRTTAAQVLRERARSGRLVQSAQGIAIIGTDRLGRINLFSPGAERILGYRAGDVFGQSIRMFHTEAEIARHARELGTDPTYVSVIRAVHDLPPGTAREWEFIREDGVTRTLSTILSPVVDESGEFVGYVATGDDVTDRLDTERALQKALATEREAVSRLTEVDTVKEAFVSSVSHELRTPITNIVGYLELLRDGVYGTPSAEQSDAMLRIDTNSRRLLALVDDLLTLSTMQDTDARRHHRPVELGQVVRRAEEIVRPTLRDRRLDLTVEVPDDDVWVLGDAGQLDRLVINLATNAVKFTPDDGSVTIRLGRAVPRKAVLEVVDTGIGIPPDEQASLFARFYRSSHARTSAVPGSGLGLSIARTIADAHRARISIRSEVGQGSTFRVELPQLPADVTEPATRAAER